MYFYWIEIKKIYINLQINLFSEQNLPRFAEPIPNITVTIGRDALLACSVDNLKGFKVNI